MCVAESLSSLLVRGNICFVNGMFQSHISRPAHIYNEVTPTSNSWHTSLQHAASLATEAALLP